MHSRSDPIRELFIDFEGIFSYLFKGIQRTLFNQKMSHLDATEKYAPPLPERKFLVSFVTTP